MKLFRYKTRNERGQFSKWSNIYTDDVLNDAYFSHWLWGRRRRKVASRVFEIIKDLQK
jgi:hypothetical protein